MSLSGRWVARSRSATTDCWSRRWRGRRQQSSAKTPTTHSKTRAALLHSLARNHALVDGKKRLALAATIAFLGVNGRRLTYSNDQAYEFIMRVVVGEVDDVVTIADHIRNATDAR